MRSLAIASFMLLVTSSLRAQELTMYRSFGSVRFEYAKDTSVYTVSPKQVLTILHDDPEAYKAFHKAKKNYNISGILGFTGGVLIVFPVITAIAGGEPEWALAAGGAALIGASLPFGSAFRRDAQRAFDLYNKKHTAFVPRAEGFIGGTGIGIRLKF